ncbi:MAG: alpha/beta family hydrolase [Terracidiphilus sp.]
MQSFDEFIDTSDKATPVRGFLHRPVVPGKDCLILTHGAGANCRSLLLTTLADAFCAAGLTVLRCDLPFRQSRPYGPPPRGSAERDQEGLRAAVASMRHHTQGRVFLGGHSYGGRQSSILAADQPGLVERLLLLSYPLHPPKQPAELRTKHFPALQVPAVFVHGTRDPFGSFLEMEEALKMIPGPTKLMPIPDAGHELMTNRTGSELAGQVVTGFLSFT